MTKIFSDIAGLIAILIGLIFGAESTGNDGPAKKAEALANVNKLLDEPGGLDYPKYLVPLGAGFRNWFLGFLIDTLVSVANRTGFFNK